LLRLVEAAGHIYSCNKQCVEAIKLFPSNLSSLFSKQSLWLRGITSSEKTGRDYELRSRGPAVRGFNALDRGRLCGVDSRYKGVHIYSNLVYIEGYEQLVF
jgi:hypothetical protein